MANVILVYERTLPCHGKYHHTRARIWLRARTASAFARQLDFAFALDLTAKSIGN